MEKVRGRNRRRRRRERRRQRRGGETHTKNSDTEIDNENDDLESTLQGCMRRAFSITTVYEPPEMSADSDGEMWGEDDVLKMYSDALVVLEKDNERTLESQKHTKRNAENSS